MSELTWDYARCRAIEFRIPVIRCVAGGISGWIDELGDSRVKSSFDAAGGKVFDIVVSKEKTRRERVWGRVAVFGVIVFVVGWPVEGWWRFRP